MDVCYISGLRPGYEKLAGEMVTCCWKGFDHEKEEGFWDGDAEHGYYTLMAQHI